jgi:hypothetical protein
LLYILFWLSLSSLIQNQARLSNWDNQFPLLIGNEGTQDRPWQGLIKHVQISDRAFTKEEVANLFIEDISTNQTDSSTVAFYDFTGNDSNNFPLLNWQGGGSVQTADSAILISKDQWLQSDQPVTTLSQSLAASSQFTAIIIAASTDLNQTGPARLLTISTDPFQRNFMIGQQNTELVLRLRTPLAGLDGSQPQFIIPNVFTDQEFHQIIITYDGLVLTVYIDNPTNAAAIELVPSIAIFTKFFPDAVEQMRINQSTPIIFRLLYSLVIFLPLSFLALIWRKSQSTWNKTKLVWLAAALIAAAALWEVLSGAVIAGYDLRLENIVLNFVVTAVTYLFLDRKV